MSGGRFGSASGIRRTINATLSPFKSFRQITPSHRRHIPIRRERRRRSPQANAGFRNGGERGASAAKQEFIPSVRYGWTSGRGLAVRFGPASWSALVIEFCQQSGFYRLPKKFLQRCVFLSAGEGFYFVGEVPFSLRSLNAAFVGGGPSVLRKTRKQRSAFSEHLSARGYGWLRRLRNEAWKK